MKYKGTLGKLAFVAFTRDWSPGEWDWLIEFGSRASVGASISFDLPEQAAADLVQFLSDAGAVFEEVKE